MDAGQIAEFNHALIAFYTDYGRHDMLWRQPEPDGTFDPYKVLVSELMLQQTQVARVTPKYTAFLEAFPTLQALSAASLGDVLRLWSGLGYNRRAKYIWQAAQYVTADMQGVFPKNLAALQLLPGVGPNTAGAIMAYTYNEPVVYVETNVRTVIIHHFFKDETVVSDVSIRMVLQQILNGSEDAAQLPPREFYWAMMDYGAHLKRTVGNLNRVSTSFSKQSAFHGSRRQLRGRVVRLVTERPYVAEELYAALDDGRAQSVVADLVAEGMIRLQNGMITAA